MRTPWRSSTVDRATAGRGLLPVLLAVLGGLGPLAGVGCSAGDAAPERPPVLITIAPQTYQVGTAHNPLLVGASDPDGDALTFSLTVALFPGDTAQEQRFAWTTPGDPLPGGMSFLPDPRQAWFDWNPLASQIGQHRLIFAVSDGRGGEDREEITVEVVPSDEGGGGPQFLTPSSYVLQLVQTDSIRAAIAVRDDASAHVKLQLQNTPEGLTFESTSEDGKRGEFAWRPTAAQIAARSIYGFLAVATDAEGNRSEQQIRIVIRTKDGDGGSPDCPGTPPQIETTPLNDQFGRADFPLTARVTDAESPIVRVFAAFTITDPQDLNSYQAAELRTGQESADGSIFSGALPNLTSPQGSEVTYYYMLCALDDDDPAGEDCDHFACVPEQAVYTFVAHPEQAPQVCADDAHEPNDTPDQATPLHGDADGAVCSTAGVDDLDVYAIDLPAFTGLRLTATFRSAEGDLDLALSEQEPGQRQGLLLGLSDSSDDVETIEFPGLPQATTVYASVYGYQHAQNGYALHAEQLGLDSRCLPDLAEPNDEAASAAVIRLTDGSATQPGLSYCGDEDWYAVDVSEGAELYAGISFAEQRGLDLALFQGEIQLDRTTGGLGGSATVGGSNLPAGRYLLRVSSDDAGPNLYTLEVLAD